MLTSAQRQAQIQSALAESEKPLTANYFAKLFDVSRQTIVGDVALLRAHGEGIIATVQGYQYEQDVVSQSVIVCRHSPKQTAEELGLIVAAGGRVLDVLIDHPLYGQLRGQLQIRNTTDINLFTGLLKKRGGKLLSELTDGIHLHTIAFERPEQLHAIKESLRKAGFLFE